ncbi:uncharacterized protein [Spinacia oleracea]|uniref:Aminotransferase-like plant mobile domain-containing protein n=1 Tax=Spinacia oleracea TaxID=3562 RepID=A0ABM3QQF0_SPIOL|nr:uncharacterized protein LOC110792195 [Spinacia oleracea]
MGRKKRPRTVLVEEPTGDAVEEPTRDIEQTPYEDSPTEEPDPANDSLGHDNSNNANVEGSPSQKRRGITLMAHIWNQPKEKRVVVEWNKYWQPIGGERSDLAHFLGTMARNPQLCTLAYTDWRLFEKEEKTGLLDIVKSKFIIPHPLAEKFTMSSMGKKWSNFKAELKLQYHEPYSGNLNMVLNNKPEIVPKDQWIALVTHWFSDEGKKRSSTNRWSREMQVMAHTGGAKNFASYAAKKTMNGVLPSRSQVYLDTHKDRKIHPAPMDVKSKQAVDMINEKMSQLPGGKEITNGIVAWDGDIYSQVMKEVIGPERRGYVRGIGRCPTSLTSISHTQHQDEHLDDNDHDACDEKIEHLYTELTRMHEKQAQTEKELAMLKALLLGRRTPNGRTPSSSTGGMPTCSLDVPDVSLLFEGFSPCSSSSSRYCLYCSRIMVLVPVVHCWVASSAVVLCSWFCCSGALLCTVGCGILFLCYSDANDDHAF